MRTLPDSDAPERTPLSRIVARLLGGVAGLALGFGVSLILKLTGFPLVLFVVAFGVATALTMEKLTHGIPQAAADFVLRIVSPSGHTTPYEKVYSQEQSLAARGDIAAALDAYDDAMRRNPDDPEPRFQAAELLFRGLNPERAAELFVAGRRLAGENRARELYATQRLIDLYLGPLDDEGRARVELRRLADRFVGTREGAGAAELLERLKRASGAVGS